jgi:hypothetical protein
MELTTSKILNGEYPITIEPIDAILKIKKLQVRGMLRIQDNIEYIANQINVNNGSLDDTKPVIIFEGVGENGNDVGINGYHTTHGIAKSISNECKTIRVPYDDIRHLSKTEIAAVAVDFNKGSIIREATNSKDDMVKFIVDAWFNDRIEPTSSYIKDHLTEWRFTPNEIPTIIKNAKHEIDKGELARKNSNFIEYTQDQLNIIRNRNTNSSTLSFVFSSALFRWQTIIPAITKDTRLDSDFNKIPNRPNLKIYVHHPNPEAQKKWDDSIKEEVRDAMDYAIIPLGYSVQIQELPYLEKNNVIK